MSPAFLTELARARPDPGGGAVAAYGARVALALVAKVVHLELQRPNRQAPEVRDWRDLLAQVRDLTAAFARLQQEDVQAYFQLTRARAEDNPGMRLAAVDEAVACPRRLMQRAAAALGLVRRAGENCQTHLVADLLVACEFLGASLRGAHHIAGANLPLAPAAAAREALAAELAQAWQTGEAIFRDTRAALRLRQTWP